MSVIKKFYLIIGDICVKKKIMKIKNFIKDHSYEIAEIILVFIGTLFGFNYDAENFFQRLFFILIITIIVTLFILNYFEIKKDINLKKIKNQMLIKEICVSKNYFCSLEKENINISQCNVKEDIINDYIKNDLSKRTIELLLENTSELKEHYLINKNQARLSFWFTLLNGVISTFVLCFAIYQVLSKSDIKNVIVIALVGIILGVFSIAGLIIHKNNVIQLNRYYYTLHEKDMFLSAISLVGNLDLNKQDEMYIEIIRSELEVRNNCAQNKTPLYRKI